MKKVLSGIFVILMFMVFTSSPANAAGMQIKIDGVIVKSDVQPEIRNNRTMVPLRVISESLGAEVHWSKSEVTVTKNDMEIKLILNSNTAIKNGKTILLDVKPFIKNSRTMVPLRFIAEAFGNRVQYKNSLVTVNTDPLVIKGVEIAALQEEYHMTMGGVVQQIKGNEYIRSIYNILIENKSSQVEEPEDYSWNPNLVNPGDYYKNRQYDFLDQAGNSINRFDLYDLVGTDPNMPKVLLYDGTENKWYLFNDAAAKAIYKLTVSATNYGFVKIISDTVV